MMMMMMMVVSSLLQECTNDQFCLRSSSAKVCHLDNAVPQPEKTIQLASAETSQKKTKNWKIGEGVFIFYRTWCLLFSFVSTIVAGSGT